MSHSRSIKYNTDTNRLSIEDDDGQVVESMECESLGDVCYLHNLVLNKMRSLKARRKLRDQFGVDVDDDVYVILDKIRSKQSGN